MGDLSESEITVMGERGQVVIPKSIRKRLNLKPKTKFIILGYGDTILLKKLELPDLKDEWDRIKEIIDERNRKHGKLTEDDVKREVEAHRREKNAQRN